MNISKTQQGRVAAAMSLATVLALTATACGDDGSGAAGAEGSGKGKIVFWDNNGGVRTDIWKEIIADFEKKYPKIDVQYVGVAAPEAQSKYDNAIQGGGLPDVGGVGTAILAGMAAQNALEPLEDRAAKSSLDGKLNESMVGSVKAAGGSDKHMYNIPISANNGVLYYRTDLFKKADLAEPTTWDALLRGRRQAHRGQEERVRLHHPRRRRLHRAGDGRDVRAVRHHLLLGPER